MFEPRCNSILNVGVKINFSTSDHSYITLDINLPVRIEPSKRTYRDLNDVDYKLLNAHLAIKDWVSRFKGAVIYFAFFYPIFLKIASFCLFFELLHLYNFHMSTDENL